MKILILPHSLQHAVELRDATSCDRGFSIFAAHLAGSGSKHRPGRPSVLRAVVSTHQGDRMTYALILYTLTVCFGVMFILLSSRTRTICPNMHPLTAVSKNKISKYETHYT